MTHTGVALSTALLVIHGPRLNFHAERELEHRKATFFSSFLQLQYPRVCCRRVVCRYSKKQVTHTTSAEVPVLHTPVEVAEVK